MTKLSAAQRRNLDKLATYLEGLPKRYRHFDMGVFLDSNGDPDALEAYALRNGGVNECGTVACAVGHGPAAGVFFPRKLAAELKLFADNAFAASYMWFQYAGLFLDASSSRSDSVFSWAFGGEWEGVDNGHRGAAARIRYLLANGLPEGFDEARPKWRKVYAPYRIDAKVPA